MANLTDYSNIHADLAQGAYNGRPENFPHDELKPREKDRIAEGKSVERDVGNDQKVYLQPDLHVQEKNKVSSRVPNVNGGFREEKHIVRTDKNVMENRSSSITYLEEYKS